MKITYNSPVILTYTLICCAILLLSQTILPLFNYHYFSLPPKASFADAGDWFRMVSHIGGHMNWGHLVANFSIILLIGPMLEEKYKGGPLLLAILLTALVTGIINSLIFTEGLMGASGIAFMMIVLGSMMNFKKGQIPLTFLLVAVLWLGAEIYNGIANKNDGISQFAHILGGVCGLAFGLISKK